MPGKITVKDDGPYVCEGVTSLRGADGSDLPVKDGMALCRCGRSATKPFCDGTHNRVGVRQPVSDKVDPQGKDVARPYEGAGVTVFWNDRVCTHAQVCVRRSAAFDPDARPWIVPDRDSLDRVRAAVRGCPSGALRDRRRRRGAAPPDRSGPRRDRGGEGRLALDHRTRGRRGRRRGRGRNDRAADLVPLRALGEQAFLRRIALGPRLGGPATNTDGGSSRPSSRPGDRSSRWAGRRAGARRGRAQAPGRLLTWPEPDRGGSCAGRGAGLYPPRHSGAPASTPGAHRDDARPLGPFFVFRTAYPP